MNETTINQIRDYEKTIYQRIQSICSKEDKDVNASSFYHKLLNNCEEMRSLSLANLSQDELETVDHYWRMMDSLTNR